MAAALVVWSGTALVDAEVVERSGPVREDGAAATARQVPMSTKPDTADRRQLSKGQRAEEQPAPPPPTSVDEKPTSRNADFEVEPPAKTVEPSAVSIPALGLDQNLIELAVNGTELQVPDDYSDVGWWRDGPVPGEKGAAVMVGHVDSPTGPAVFYQLSGMQPGHRVTIGLDDGSRTVFEVREVTAYHRSSFPSAKVYRTQGRPGLNLLTCGGSFDSEAGRYSSNVVVYAALVDRIPAPEDKKPSSKKSVQEMREQLGLEPDERSGDGLDPAADRGAHDRVTYEQQVQANREALGLEEVDPR